MIKISKFAILNKITYSNKQTILLNSHFFLDVNDDLFGIFNYLN